MVVILETPMEDIVEILTPMIDSVEVAVPIHDVSCINPAVFGQIVFGRSTYGFGITSGAVVLGNQMIDDVELNCTMDDNMVVLSLMED